MRGDKGSMKRREMEKAKMSQRFSAVFASTLLQMYGMIILRAIKTTSGEEKYCDCSSSCFSSAALIKFSLFQLLVLYYFHSFCGLLLPHFLHIQAVQVKFL